MAALAFLVKFLNFFSKRRVIAAEGSTPNLDMKVLQSSLDPVFRADLCVVEIEILCLSTGGQFV